MSVKIDGTQQSTDPTFNSVTVYDTFIVSNKYRLPTGSPLNGDVIMADGSKQLIFGPVSADGYVISNAVSATTGNITVYDDNSPIHINDSGIPIANILQNPMMSNLDMNTYDILGVGAGGVSILETGLPTLPVVNAVKIYANNSDHTMYTLNHAGQGNRILWDYSESGFNWHIKDNKLAFVNPSNTDCFYISPLGDDFIIHNPVLAHDVFTIFNSNNLCLFEGDVSIEKDTPFLSITDTQAGSKDAHISFVQTGVGDTWRIGFQPTTHSGNFSISDESGDILVIPVASNNVQIINTLEANGAIVHIDDKVGAGSEELQFYTNGTIQSFITSDSNSVSIRNSSHNPIASFNQTLSTNIFGPCTLNTGSNQYTFPLNTGSASQALITDGAGTTTWTTLPLQLFSFGGFFNSPGTAARFVYNGTASTGVNDASAPLNRVTSPYAGVITTLVYDTAGGDSTTQLEIMLNNVSQGTFLITSGHAVLNGFSISVSQNDTIGVRYTGTGTNPGASHALVMLKATI